jgi:prephenate dehydrogenase
VILGTGLIGTSIALALTEKGVEVHLDDPDARSLALAVDLGAGRRLAPDTPETPADIAVLAAPPAAVPTLLRSAQDRGLAHVYTDVASVKARVAEQARELGCDLATFVPGHPMGGREKAGPGAARADLFLGRSWALCSLDKTDPGARATATRLAELCGAVPVEMAPEIHDRAVALVSHAPHVASSAVAARLLHGDDQALALSGQGVRDVTRIAAGDPGMWVEILGYNAAPVAEVLQAVSEDLAACADALRGSPDTPRGPRGAEPVRDLLTRGQEGHRRIPGKHGTGTEPGYAVLAVVIPDQPGALADLFAGAGRAGVNIEDVRIDHSPGLPVGVAQLSVRPEHVGHLAEALGRDGWSVHG